MSSSLHRAPPISMPSFVLSCRLRRGLLGHGVEVGLAEILGLALLAVLLRRALSVYFCHYSFHEPKKPVMFLRGP